MISRSQSAQLKPHPAAIPQHPPSPSRLRAIARRKIFWVVLLAVGYWFATPYYFPHSAAEELTADARAMTNSGSIDRELALPCLALVAAYMLWRSRPLPRMRGYLFNATILYLLYDLASISWSVDPQTSIKRYVVFLMDVLLITAICKVYSAIDMARIGFFVCGFAGIFAFLVDVVVTRTFAPLNSDYRLMGIMSSNYMGENLTVTIFCGLTLLLHDPKRSKWLVPGLLFFFFLLYITRSRTATIACLVLSMFFIKRLVERKYSVQVRILAGLLLIGLVGGVLIASGDAANVAETSFMMGRNDTQNTSNLSNRLPLWTELMGYVRQRPWTGYGYNAFWTTDRIALISAHQKWSVPNAHNTYLDQYLSSGPIGMLLYIFVFWGALIVSWRRALRNPEPELLLPAVLLSWIFFTSWFEAIPLDPFLPTSLGYVCILKTFLPIAKKPALADPAAANLAATDPPAVARKRPLRPLHTIRPKAL